MMKKQLKSGEWMVKAGNQILHCKTEAEADIALALAEEGPPVGSLCCLAVIAAIFLGYLLGVA